MMTGFTVAGMPAFRAGLVGSLTRRVRPRDRTMAEELSDEARTRSMPIAPPDLVRWGRTAELFFVADAMSAVVDQATRSRPPYRLRHDDLPASVGLLVFARPIEIDVGIPSVAPVPADRREDVEACPVRGFLWAPAMTRPGPGVVVVPFTERDVMERTWWFQEHVKPAVSAGVMQLLRTDRLVFLDPIPLTFETLEPDRQVSRAVGMALTTWLLMGQRLAHTAVARTAPAVKGPAGRRRPRETVKVVTLRRFRDAPHEAEPGHSSREFHVQWIVSGHWHTYRVGHGRAEERLLWVGDYAKGPPDAPMIGGERVSVLRR